MSEGLENSANSESVAKVSVGEETVLTESVAEISPNSAVLDSAKSVSGEKRESLL